jgi:GAF domain-containing protein
MRVTNDALPDVRAALTRALGGLFDTARYSNPLDKDRARVVYTLLALLLGLYTLNVVFVPQVAGETLLQALLNYGSVTETTILFASLYLFAFAGFGAVRNGRLGLGSALTLAAWYAGGIGIWLYNADTIRYIGTPLLIFMLLASLVFQIRGIVLGLGVSMATVVLSAMSRSDQPLDAGFYSLVVVWLLSGALVLLFTVRFFRISLTEGVSEALEERANASGVVARATEMLSRQVASGELIAHFARDVVETFEAITRARVYLLEESGIESRLVTDTARTEGDIAPSVTIRASLDGMSTIAQVMQSGRMSLIQRDAAQAEALFPLRVGGRVLGVLNVLSDAPRTLNRPDLLDALQELCDNAALVIDNVRQFERAEARQREIGQLVSELQTTLRERERLTQRLTGSAWAQYIRNAPNNVGLAVNFDGDSAETSEAMEDAAWTRTLAEAIKVNQFLQDMAEDKQIVTMPLRVRGQVIGAMEFELDANRQFTPEDFELMQEVSERFGLAADNTRLVQESQRLAQREALVNQITARLQSTNNVQGTLTEAARGLQDAFKASKVVIRLGSAAEGRANGSGGEA